MARKYRNVNLIAIILEVVVLYVPSLRKSTICGYAIVLKLLHSERGSRVKLVELLSNLVTLKESIYFYDDPPATN